MPITPIGDTRGISSVIGVTLIIGMVIAASAVIVVVGATTLDNTQQSISTENARVQMEELNARLLEVATTPGEQAQMTISTSGDAALAIKDTGWINLTVENRTGANVSTGQMTLGQLTYTVNDQEFTIQSGGLWQSNVGSDGATMLSRPTIGYNFHRSNPTLGLSVLDISGLEREGDTISFERDGTPTEKLRSINPIQPGSQLHITVKSELYRAWGDYFENRLQGKVTYNDGENTVTAEVPAMPEPVELDAGVIAKGNLSLKGAAEIDGGVSLGGFLDTKKLDQLDGDIEENVTINNQLKNASSVIDEAYSQLKNESKLPDSGQITAGNYFAENDDALIRNGPKHIPTFNTSNGDIQLFIDGEMKHNLDIDVVGNGDVEIFVNGTAHMNGAGVWGSKDQVDAFTIYSKGNTRITGFYGTLYTEGLEIAGKPKKTAGLVGAAVVTSDSITVTGSNEITYNDVLQDVEVVPAKAHRGGPARIKYIQVRHSALT